MDSEVRWKRPWRNYGIEFLGFAAGGVVGTALLASVLSQMERSRTNFVIAGLAALTFALVCRRYQERLSGRPFIDQFVKTLAMVSGVTGVMCLIRVIQG